MLMKNISIFIVLAFVLAVFTSCNSGDGGGLNILPASIRSAAYDPVTNCVVEQVHQHNGAYYSGHYNNDGHGHHGLHADDVCAVNTCTETGLHQHNGIHYAGHHGSDAHDYHGDEHHL
jgi:hypothetical protein